MAYTTINKSTANFNTKLYTGNGGTQSITGVGFQPDWSWFKKRNGSADSALMDSVRGVRKQLTSNSTHAEYTESAGLSAWGSDGFSFDGAGYDHVNTNGSTFASWNWKAGTSFSNSAGANGATIASTGSVNQDAGFSIVSYTGNGSAGATIGHGLGSVPKMFIVKKRSAAGAWNVYHSSLGNTKAIQLDLTSAPDTNSVYWNNTSPTSSVLSLGTSAQVNGSGVTYICYCFAEKTGYSKFEQYRGNGSTNGCFVYTGFKPAFVMVKKYSGTAEWFMFDNKRLGYNPENYRIMANRSDAEADPGEFDLLSNGFKFRFTSNNANGTNDYYIFMAFAKAPLVGTNNVPCTAK